MSKIIVTPEEYKRLEHLLSVINRADEFILGRRSASQLFALREYQNILKYVILRGKP